MPQRLCQQPKGSGIDPMSGNFQLGANTPGIKSNARKLP
jgi:hypothetical protein